MLAFLFPFAILSAKYNMPKYSYIWVDYTYPPSQYDEYEDYYNKNQKEEFESACTSFYGDKKEKCEAIAKAFKKIVISNGADLDKRLGKIPKDTDFLYYIGPTTDYEINLNSLKSQMAVHIDSEDATDPFSSNKIDIADRISKKLRYRFNKMMETSFDGSRKSIIRFTNEISKRKNKIPQYGTTMLVGDIKKKCSFLIISHQVVSFRNDLDVDNLYFYYTKISSSSDKIKAKFCQIDEYSHSNYIMGTSIESKIDAYQYTIVNLEEEVRGGYLVTISYRHDYLYMTRTKRLSSGTESYSVPYKFGQTFAINTLALYIDINVYDTSLEQYKTLNITISDYVYKGPRQLELDTIHMSSSGDWDSVTNKPTIYITTETSKYEVDQESLGKDGLSVKVEDRYSYKPKKSGLSTAAIIGIVVGVIVVVIIVVVIVVVVVVMKKKKNGVQNSSNGENNNQNGQKQNPNAANTSQPQNPQQQQQYNYAQGNPYQQNQPYPQQQQQQYYPKPYPNSAYPNQQTYPNGAYNQQQQAYQNTSYYQQQQAYPNTGYQQQQAYPNAPYYQQPPQAYQNAGNRQQQQQPAYQTVGNRQQQQPAYPYGYPPNYPNQQYQGQPYQQNQPQQTQAQPNQNDTQNQPQQKNDFQEEQQPSNDNPDNEN